MLKKFGLFKNVCIIFAVCAASAIASHAQIYSKVHQFQYSGPAGLVQGTDGNFYGTTSAGGVSNKGTVFKITPWGVLTTLHSFSGNDGAGPNGLVQGTDGNFYGTTLEGGTDSDCPYVFYDGCGTVFKITTAGTLTTLYSFDYWHDGAYPWAALV